MSDFIAQARLARLDWINARNILKQWIHEINNVDFNNEEELDKVWEALQLGGIDCGYENNKLYKVYMYSNATITPPSNLEKYKALLNDKSIGNIGTDECYNEMIKISFKSDLDIAPIYHSYVIRKILKTASNFYRKSARFLE